MSPDILNDSSKLNMDSLCAKVRNLTTKALHYYGSLFNQTMATR